MSLDLTDDRVRHQANTWSNVDQVLWRHMMSLDLKQISLKSKFWPVPKFVIVSKSAFVEVIAL